MIHRLDSGAVDFQQALYDLTHIPAAESGEIGEQVKAILAAVKSTGDAAVMAYTNRFDRRAATRMIDLEIGQTELKAAFESIDPLVKEALIDASERIARYHEAQLRAVGGGKDWQFVDDDGNELGQRVRAMARVGLYAPGGKASYPSTVLMTAIPARVAGVGELILCVPAPDGELNDVLLAAAYLAGVDRVFSIGGAQAIAAMAYGTQTIPRVDKIVGPGNIYVATAKEQVFGAVGIDMIAGPSEVVIIADDTADPEWIVQDLFAQAEHDEMAQSILISASDALLAAVAKLLPEKLGQATRKSIIEIALNDRGALIKAASLSDAIVIANQIAPEHLQLSVANPDEHLDHISHAGAIFLGSYTTEVVGDYTAGPSHVLPTNGSARFGSALGVYDFQVRSSLVRCSPAGSIRLNRGAAILARAEGLNAHAESAERRVKG